MVQLSLLFPVAARACFALALILFYSQALADGRAGVGLRLEPGWGLNFASASPVVPIGRAPAGVGLTAWQDAGSGTDSGSAGHVEDIGDPAASHDCAGKLHLPWGPIDTCKEAVVIASATGLALVAYAKWWRKGLSPQWMTAHEGWFQRETYAGGVDKMAHGYSLYVGTRLLTRALDWAEAPHEHSVRIAAGIGLSAALAIEVFDALSKKAYGFSKEDLISGALGVGLATIMELRPGLDRYFAYRMMYRAPFPPDNLPQPLDDYERQIYLVALRLSGFEMLGPRNPLRYIELVAGYGATGFHVDGGGPFEARRRVLYYGVAIDLTKVAQALFFRPGGGTAEAVTTEALRYLQPPGSVVWAKSTF